MKTFGTGDASNYQRSLIILHVFFHVYVKVMIVLYVNLLCNFLSYKNIFSYDQHINFYLFGKKKIFPQLYFCMFQMIRLDTFRVPICKPLQ